MARTFVRYDAGDGARWGEKFGEAVYPLVDAFASTGELIIAARGGDARADQNAPAINLAQVRPLPPITRHQQLVAQATNYRSHVREVGGDPGQLPGNVFFGKAISSLCGARDPIVKPQRVRLLDYEVELGLVIGRAIRGAEPITEANLGDWLAGLVIANDVSARDLQIPEGQFYKGKSFRTFTPVGPYLVLVEADDLRRLDALELSLSVNDQLRQCAPLSDMIFRPAETLAELSEVMDLDPGDLVITGTPGGVALQPPGALLQKIAGLLPPRLRFKLFIEGQVKRGGYLTPGDVVCARIRSPDGRLDLGEQVNVVVSS